MAKYGKKFILKMKDGRQHDILSNEISGLSDNGFQTGVFCKSKNPVRFFTDDIVNITQLKKFVEASLNKMNAIDFQYQGVIVNITEDILVYMEDHDVSKSQLARKINKPEEWVVDFLAGDKDITLSELSGICFELGVKPVIEIKEKGCDK